MDNKKVYVIHIKDWEEPLIGIVESSSRKWILIKKITSDYRFDGYSIIQRCHIKSCRRTKENRFIEKVLIANGVIDITPFQIPLEDRLTPLKWLCTQQKTVEIWITKDSTSFLGKIKEVRTIIFHWMSMDSRGEWGVDFYTPKIRTIVSIDMDTDYILSLLIYNQSKT